MTMYQLRVGYKEQRIMTLYESLHRMTGEPRIIRIEICSHNIDVLQDFDADQVPPEYFPYEVYW